jgi:two-component system response regulator GlrR
MKTPIVTRILKSAQGHDVLVVRCGRVKVVRGPDKGQQVHLGGQTTLSMGTDPDAGLRLTDDSVSRAHAELRLEAEGYVLRDLGSTNGTRIEGLRVREVMLNEKARFSLGETDLEFSLIDEELHHDLAQTDRFGSVLGRSPLMRALFATLARAAESEATVLIEGETGTGKQAIAESLHRASGRKAGPFIVIDCSSIPPNLIEAELFGHAAGAFTGATKAREGAFVAAAGGTLFLDEIGELPLETQSRFLRVLEERQVKPVGQTDYVPVDFRILAATHRDLERLVADGKFRSDLYYRLAVVRVGVPALRAHPEDIPLLSRHLVRQLRADADPAKLLTDGLIAAFQSHPWPGNVRELRNAIERVLALGPAAGLPGAAPTPGDYHQEKRLAIDRFEQMFCERLLAQAGGVVTRAAEAAGISRQLFHRILQKHNLTGARAD